MYCTSNHRSSGRAQSWVLALWICRFLFAVLHKLCRLGSTQLLSAYPSVHSHYQHCLSLHFISINLPLCSFAQKNLNSDGLFQEQCSIPRNRQLISLVQLLIDQAHYVTIEQNNFEYNFSPLSFSLVLAFSTSFNSSYLILNHNIILNHTISTVMINLQPYSYNQSAMTGSFSKKSDNWAQTLFSPLLQRSFTCKHAKLLRSAGLWTEQFDTINSNTRY